MIYKVPKELEVTQITHLPTSFGGCGSHLNAENNKYTGYRTNKSACYHLGIG